MSKPVCVILGVGPGNGISIAKKFSDEGYSVALCARNLERLLEDAKDIKNAYEFKFDVTNVEDHKEIFDEIKRTLGPVSVLIYNAGSGEFSNIDGASVVSFQSAWEVNALGLFLAAKQVIPDMKTRGGGNIVAIGATASLRGGANFLPFASAKAAQRSLAQSLSKHLGKDKIHVSYVIVDGIIDLERTRKNMPDKKDDFFINPDDVAESVYFLTQQPQSTWTFELDLRPFGEQW